MAQESPASGSRASESGVWQRFRAWVLTEFPLLLFVLSVVALRMILYKDLSFADEAGYVRTGLLMLRGVRPAWSDFPGYAGIYALAYLISRSASAAYFIGQAVAAATIVLGTWVGVRMFASSRAAFATCVLVTALGAPYVWPAPGTVAAGLLVIGCALLIARPDAAGCALASLFFWAAFATRSEFWPAALACSVCTLWYLIRDVRAMGGGAPASGGRTARMHLVLPALSLLIPVALVSLGLPLGSGRLWIAFGQHYALVHPIAGQSPWLDWQAVLARDFGTASSIPAAALAAPEKFWSFLGGNVLRTPLYLGGIMLDRHSPFVGAVALSALASLMLLIPLAVVFARWLSLRRTARAPGARRVRMRVAYLPIIVLAVVNIAILIVIFPRDHYIVLWVPVLAVLSGVLAERTFSPKVAANFFTAAMLLVLLPMVASTFYNMARVPEKPLLAAVDAADSLPGHHVLVSQDWGLSVYARDLSETSVGSIAATHVPFAAYARAHNVDMVLIDSDLESADSSVLGLRDFVVNPRKFGFSPIVPGSQLWVRSSER